MRTILTIIPIIPLVGACATEAPDTTGTTSSAVTSANKLAANKLAANKLAANKLAANKLAANSLQSSDLIDTADGREVLSYIISCALAEGDEIEVVDSNDVHYTFPGSIGLAPDWATQAPSVAERHWVTACVLSRTNYFGISVQLSLRGDHPALATTSEELEAFSFPEAAFYGDLFDPDGIQMYACQAPQEGWTPTIDLRVCAVSDDGVTTRCGFTYTGSCEIPNGTMRQTCSDSTFAYGGCRAGTDAADPDWSEVISVALATP